MNNTSYIIQRCLERLHKGTSMPIPSESLRDEFPAWVYRKDESRYAVCIPWENSFEVNENFAGAQLLTTEILVNRTKRRVLMLMLECSKDLRPFAFLCSEFTDPGQDGCHRQEVSRNPSHWWQQWKMLLGNRNVDERVYDVIAELLTLLYLKQNGIDASWGGPDAATYDIETIEAFYEVKSSISRARQEITLSNSFQLIPPDNRKLKLMFYQFEPMENGISINSIVQMMIRQSFDETEINTKLESLGFGLGRSDRDRCFIVHRISQYSVDETFPAIRMSDFVNGCLPTGVSSLTYSVDLSCQPVEKNLSGWFESLTD